ncbi:MAG TPA: hypothetical protein VGA16_12465 [Candidatus Limnocylindria bacterium]
MHDHGASTQSWGLFVREGERLAAVRQEGVGLLRLGVAGSVTHGGGFRCEPGRLDVLAIADRPPDYDTYYWSRRALAWTGPATVRETGRAEGSIVARTLEDRTRPEFAQYWQARCTAAAP